MTDASINSTITSNIYENRTGKITAAVLNAVLMAIVAWVLANFQATIRVDTTLSVPAQYATVQAAIDSLKTYDIAPGATVTIDVAAGEFDSAAPIVYGHHDGQRIKVRGATPIALTVTGIGSVTGSNGAWTLPVNVSSAAGVSAGMVLQIATLSGTDWEAAAGGWLVTGVSGNTINVLHKGRFPAWPSITVSGGSIQALRTVLKFNGANGVVGQGATGLIDQVAIVGDNTAGTIGVTTATLSGGASQSAGSVNLGSSVAVLNFGDANVLAQSAGSIHIQAGATSTGANIYGYHAQESGSLFANNTVVAGNGSHNVIAQYGGSIYMQGGITTGAYECGVLAQLGGTILLKDGTAEQNALSVITTGIDAGICAFHNGTVQAGGAKSSTNLNGVYAYHAGHVYFQGADSDASDNLVSGITSVDANVDAQAATIAGNGSKAVACDVGGKVDVAGSATTGVVYGDRACEVFLNGNTGSATLSNFPAWNTPGSNQQIAFNR